LLAAAQDGHLQCVEYLLKAGADIHTIDKAGDTALSAAVLKNHVDCVRTLVQYGADITIKVDGQSLDDIADDSNNSDELKAALRVPAKKQRRCEQCDTTTTGQMLKCGVCKAAYYCDGDCQKANWQLHKQVCSTVKMNSDKLQASLRVPAKKQRRCEQCDVTTAGQIMYKCGACLSVYYCDRDCQGANWQLHKLVCNAADAAE
jgi:formamidopyrimidine-DNA glycosylase